MKNLLFLLLFTSYAVYAQPNIGAPADIVVCDQDSNTVDGQAIINLTVNNTLILNGLNPDNYTIAYFATQQEAVDNVNAVVSESNVLLNNGQTIFVRLTDIVQPDNFATESFSIIINTPAILTQLDPFIVYDADGVPDGTVIFDLTQFELDILSPFTIPDVVAFSYYATLNDAENATNPILNPASYALTTQTVFFRVVTAYGCFTIGSYNTTVNGIAPPTGEATQTFTEGNTLADLNVEGENLKWYATPASQDILPLTTLLVNGTTYYVSQTVNGVESARLGVTVNLPLGVSTNKFAGLSYYPNPVKDVFTVSNNNAIDAVRIFNIMGQQVSSKTVNNTNATVDFSALNSGVYFVQLTSGGSQKTIKVVKE
ncbi:T9SS type A sorting domain-containing protein [Flavobacterium subsaxonicum]|uniref:Secretion system C-terminal sorting domain-containing protein n=1 Tax=Flavobacterium subsaxonicum WB 4.1-42 = DSM 21790 TaxID=1121898 RepID=A0A0A2MLA2_9FLAO|nr:T9SS type A sorting domain-containing protein [Flavobacterium subsaxonicum]KGO92228.1 hypothetical protein Q766_13805 [Flavobacterium subsaxonicum WB 4.1-42 = DSM 21790]